ncbi:HAMP domain-containing sensor histidine kinase [Lutibacter sp.]|uniref:sensor histidine kinase n=1 Tax=Lutibacter sp. TaxID=1925666 RepID=UPI001A2F8FB4|nr:HAMP domain-containing sensor histidine kinase [Lutibacter sp.]MBI9040969.1 HAMP domain-containing histidine kinase [Lutibacter sp.]
MFEFGLKIENKILITCISFITLSCIGLLDYYTGSEVSVLLAYLIPILLISFHNKSEKTLLIINAFFAATIWFTVDYTTINYSNLFNPIWNAFVRFIVFMIIGMLVLNLKEKYKSVLKLNEDLKLINEEKNKFIGVAAHDLRNPIGAIYSFSDLIIENYSEKIDVKGMKMMNHIKSLSSNSLKLLEDLLDVSKIESGTIKLQLKKENYIDFITKYMYFNLLVAKKKDINIRLETNDNELFFPFDEHYLSEVINNLLTNAIKFSYPKSEIIIKISTSKSVVKTEIIDQGQGIPVEEQTKLFNYFQKTSVQPTNGETSTGLGLAIAKKIISEHKGTIGVISEINKGATFYFELPLKYA